MIRLRVRSLFSLKNSFVNLLDEAKTRCKVLLAGQAGMADEWTAEELEHAAETLGHGAVMYENLKNNRLTNYTFSFDQMLNEKFDIKKFDGTGDFGLWRIKMRALLIQHACEAALEVLPADMDAQTKAELNKKAHSAMILCLGNKVLREVTREMTAAGVWTKLETLYMTKSLVNKLYMKKKLYTFYMQAGRKISEHIDEFNKIVLDLADIEVKFEDEDLVLSLLTSLPASYEHFVDTLLYGGEALTLEDVMATLNSKEIKERSKAKGDDGEGVTPPKMGRNGNMSGSVTS
ncbi:retrovirus-related pol polyprotein from transposon TNT 1-94 [Tanacetum coccineum]